MLQGLSLISSELGHLSVAQTGMPIPPSAQARLIGLVAQRLVTMGPLSRPPLPTAQEGTLRLTVPERSPALSTRPLQLQHPFAAGLIPRGGARCSTML